MRIGIIGNGENKFTPAGKARALVLINELLREGAPGNCLVSGHSPVGGIDIWAEEVADFHHLPKIIHAPRQHSWHGEFGYRERNLAIARDSERVHVIVADALPPDYRGPIYDDYHCMGTGRPAHVKSGACWTAKQAMLLGKLAVWHIINNGSGEPL